VCIDNKLECNLPYIPDAASFICNYGFNKNATYCKPYISNCKNEYPLNKCIACLDNFLLINGECVYQPNMFAVKSVRSNQFICNIGYYYYSVGEKCRFCGPKCLQCTDDKICLVCEYPYYLDNSICTLVRNSTFDTLQADITIMIPHCEVSIGLECLKCNAGTFLLNKACIRIIL
jgi:hypothetical protein